MPLQGDALQAHVQRVCDSYRRWTGKALIETTQPLAEALDEAGFALLSHDARSDPVFNYGNRLALKLFAMDAAQLCRTPSRLSAEPVNREERDRLLARVHQHGFIDDYAGVRIAADGHRFRIEQATVWNVLDADGQLAGQAAMFAHWQPLASSTEQAEGVES